MHKKLATGEALTKAPAEKASATEQATAIIKLSGSELTKVAVQTTSTDDHPTTTSTAEDIPVHIHDNFVQAIPDEQPDDQPACDTKAARLIVYRAICADYKAYKQEVFGTTDINTFDKDHLSWLQTCDLPFLEAMLQQQQAARL